MPKSQRDRSKRGSIKAPSANGTIALGRLVTLIDKQDALNMLSKVAASGKYYHPGIDAAIRGVTASSSVQIRATQLELAGANLQGDKDVHVTFNDLEPALKAAQEEIAKLKARLEALEHSKPPSPPRPPSTNVQGTGSLN